MPLSASADLAEPAPVLSPEEDEARFVTRLAADLIVAHLRAFKQTEIDGPNMVRMAHRLLCEARRTVATSAGKATA